VTKVRDDRPVNPVQDGASLRALLRALPVFAVDLPAAAFASPPVAPEELFQAWLREAIAAGEPEPHAMTLSTTGRSGFPDARVLILKDIDARGWWFAGNRSSPKGQQLKASPGAALTFHWKTLGRQVRVRGTVTPGSTHESEQDLLARSEAARATTSATDWTVYALAPSRIEFWQADAGRQHHRLRYCRTPNGEWLSCSECP
jgi:pyridoxamine 5'-phosphate oxidase